MSTTPHPDSPAFGADIEFVPPTDNTAENRAIVQIIHDRSRAAGQPRDLEDVIRDLGYDPAKFVVRD